ncbi:MAG TPA: alpha/beta fold hydrolase [Thermoanaerobaculia bacterium]|jgi:predicted alpha/beta-fold hydrolase
MDGEHANFTPAWWLRGAHLQTVWGRLARSRTQVSLRREALTAPDGDTLLLDHADVAVPAAAPPLLILHGLEGSSHSVYAQGMLALAAKAGLRASVLNFRSCARDLADLRRTIPNERPRLYHSGETADFDFVARTLVARHGRPILAAGISLGGNVLLKWLGEHPEERIVSAAATLSVPYDLAAGDRHLASFPSALYVRSFVKTLTLKTAALARRFPEVAARLDVARASRAWTFREFDDAANAPLHGFAGAADYYSRCSSLPVLSRIAVPTLCVSAFDDPFLPPEAIRRARDAASSAVRFVVTDRGGHAGFVAARGLTPVYWGEELVIGFLRRHAGGDDSPDARRGA